MAIFTKLSLLPLLTLVSSLYCVAPIFAFLDITASIHASVLQPSRLQNTLPQTIMKQQQSTTETTSDSSTAATSDKDPSSGMMPTTVALFPPTSKYHSDQNGLSQRRRWLVVDFDGTCTEHDTTPLLPRLAAAVVRQRSSVATAIKESNGGDSGTNGSIDDHKRDLERRLSQFQLLEDEFMRLFGEAKTTLLSNDKRNGEGQKEEVAKSIHDILDALDEPSNIVTQLVSESRVLEGLGHADARELGKALQLHGVSTPLNDEEGVESVGEHKNGDANIIDEEIEKVVVRLRHGCERTLARILSDDKGTNNEGNKPQSCNGWSLAVLSINWCPALIDATLVQPVLKKRRNNLCIESCETEIPIWSNHVNGEGYVTLHVPGALAKRDRIMELRRQIHQQRSDDTSVIVYVGDSSTDLAALLEADIGIIIGQSSSMISIAEQWGIQIVSSRHRSQHGFGSSPVESVDIWRKKKLLWQVDSWQEIDEMLIEIDEHWS